MRARAEAPTQASPMPSLALIVAARSPSLKLFPHFHPSLNSLSFGIPASHSPVDAVLCNLLRLTTSARACGDFYGWIAYRRSSGQHLRLLSVPPRGVLDLSSSPN